jgi:hypothetical protein
MEIDSIRESWQAQPEALATLTAKLVRLKAKSMLLTVWRRAAIDVVGMAALGTALLATAVVSETWMCRIGCALAGAGYCYTSYRLLRGSILPASPEGTDLRSCIHFYRANLELLRDRAATVFWWVILPSAPGVVLALTGWAISTTSEWTLVARVAVAWGGLLRGARKRCGYWTKWAREPKSRRTFWKLESASES